jgi:hypothetical protein
MPRSGKIKINEVYTCTMPAALARGNNDSVQNETHTTFREMNNNSWNATQNDFIKCTEFNLSEAKSDKIIELAQVLKLRRNHR